MTVCQAPSCSSDSLLFGGSISGEAWTETITGLKHLKYQEPVNKTMRGLIEAICEAEDKA